MSRPQWETSCASSLELSVLILSDAEVCAWNLGDKRADTTSVFAGSLYCLCRGRQMYRKPLGSSINIKLCYDQWLKSGIP